DHDDDDIASFGDGAGGLASLRPLVGQDLRNSGTVIDMHRMPGIEQMPRHRRSHDSRSDESDVHDPLLLAAVEAKTMSVLWVMRSGREYRPDRVFEGVADSRDTGRAGDYCGSDSSR